MKFIEMETNKKCKECGEEFQNEVDNECPKCGNGKVEKNVRVTLHTYREGGSMICDEQKTMKLSEIPSIYEMRELIMAYQEEIKYEGDVFYNISGRVEGGNQ